MSEQIYILARHNLLAPFICEWLQNIHLQPKQ